MLSAGREVGSIRVRVTGVFTGRPINETFEEPFRQQDTLKRILARLDKKKVLGRRFFSSIVRNERAAFLLNGNRLDIPEALNKPLTVGDEISVISAIAGGCDRLS